MALFFNLYTITSSTLQSLNKFKAVYFTSIFGFFLNAILDIPFMILFHHLGMDAFIGACVATIVGYSSSIVLALVLLRKDHKLSYRSIFDLLVKVVVPLFLMIGVVVFLKWLIPVQYTSKLSCIFYVGVISSVGVFVYLFVSYKMGILENVFGKEYLNKIIKKLTLGKISIS